MTSRNTHLVPNISSVLNFNLPRIDALRFPIPPSVGLFVLCGLMAFVVVVRIANTNFYGGGRPALASAVTRRPVSKPSEGKDMIKARAMVPAKEMIHASKDMIKAETLIPAKEMIEPRATAMIEPRVTAMIKPRVTAMIEPRAIAMIEHRAKAMIEPRVTAMIEPRATA